MAMNPIIITACLLLSVPLLVLLIQVLMGRAAARRSGATQISARIILDSVNPVGERITTVECTFNRYLLAELNTHRILSRNSASSRAIPVKKVMSQVWRDPAMPMHWGTNQAGMQARAELYGWRRWLAKRTFRWARIPVLMFVWFLTRLKLHKQVANRLLEPWVWHTVVITATDWVNFFKLRLHPDAQPEFQELAYRIKDAMRRSTPKKLDWGEWHMPYTDSQDDLPYRFMTLEFVEEFPIRAYISVARCAAVSYVRQGEKREPGKDIDLTVRLRSSGHWSPFEHVARAEEGPSGNFTGWKQLRKFYPSEDGKVMTDARI